MPLGQGTKTKDWGCKKIYTYWYINIPCFRNQEGCFRIIIETDESAVFPRRLKEKIYYILGRMSMIMKKIGLLLLAGMMMCSLTACGGTTGQTEKAKESTNQKMELKLAHNLAEDHPLHLAAEQFAKEVNEGTNGDITIKIYPNAMLGNEREVLEQLQNGAIDITRVGAASLENFSELFSAFTVPYIFDSEEHFYKVMDSEIADEIYTSSQEQGLLGLTYYDGGARSFYTKNTPINSPADLKGLKIRVMENPSSIRMMEVFDASATPMAYGDIYTALQQGVLDGAENNPTALTLGKHGEVAKYYSFDEHTRIPDFMIISTATWEKISPEYQEVIKTAAKHSTEYHTKLWKESVDASIKEAQEKYGVQMVYPDKASFQEAVAPIYEELKENQAVYDIVQKILNYK